MNLLRRFSQNYERCTIQKHSQIYHTDNYRKCSRRKCCWDYLFSLKLFFELIQTLNHFEYDTKIEMKRESKRMGEEQKNERIERRKRDKEKGGEVEKRARITKALYMHEGMKARRWNVYVYQQRHRLNMDKLLYGQAIA